MSESTRKIFSSRPRALSQMLDWEQGSASEWPEEELAAMLLHEWTTPWSFDLPGAAPLIADQTQLASDRRAGMSRSCADLFSDPDVSRELLIMVKDYAKAALVHPESPILAPVAEALYFASIALALNRWGQLISQLPPASLRRHFQRLVGQTWVTDPIRATLRGGIRALDARPPIASRASKTCAPS